MASSAALEPEPGSVTTSLTSNSRAFWMKKQTFAGEIDSAGATAIMGRLHTLRPYQLPTPRSAAPCAMSNFATKAPGSPTRWRSPDQVLLDLSNRMLREVLVDLGNDPLLHVGMKRSPQVGERAR